MGGQSLFTDGPKDKNHFEFCYSRRGGSVAVERIWIAKYWVLYPDRTVAISVRIQQLMAVPADLTRYSNNVTEAKTMLSKKFWATAVLELIENEPSGRLITSNNNLNENEE